MEMTNSSSEYSPSQSQKIREALNALVAHQKSSVSMKKILREMRSEAPSEQQISHETLALGVIRYLNTIDFLISYSLGSLRLQSLTDSDRNLLRLLLYMVRYLKQENAIHYLDGKDIRFSETIQRATKCDLNAAVRQLPRLNQSSILYSHPTFIVETMLKHLGETETLQLLSANNRSRIQYLRPNRNRSSSRSAIQSLKTLGVGLEPDPRYDDLYRVTSGIEAIVSSDLFQRGDVFIQDKASVLMVYALDTSPDDIVWDACASPGMKTQLISEFMKNSGRIVASDIYRNRVQTAKDRFDLLGVKNTTWIQADASKMKVNGATKILIDAPCTSTGIIQSHPSFKWRLNKKVLMSIMSVQHKILDGILTAYGDQPGTEIVYATCSVLPHEGESQIDSIMKTHNVELMNTKIAGDTGYRGFQCSKMVRRLFPHKHETSGFFVSRMRIME